MGQIENMGEGSCIGNPRRLCEQFWHAMAGFLGRIAVAIRSFELARYDIADRRCSLIDIGSYSYLLVPCLNPWPCQSPYVFHITHKPHMKLKVNRTASTPTVICEPARVSNV